MSRRAQKQRGSASVEHVALVLLAAALAMVTFVGAREVAGRAGTPPLASELLRKQRCAVRYPGPCWQDPLTEAYGRALAGAVRALAPAPATREGLVGVDFRHCRQARCAVPLAGPRGSRLTVSNRRTTTFTSVRELKAGTAIDYWIYRPTLGWERRIEEVGPAELRALASTPLPESADPKLVPLETLLGRDEARFRAGEMPPWRGRVESRWGGR
jgi:hypothetical protein